MVPHHHDLSNYLVKSTGNTNHKCFHTVTSSVVRWLEPSITRILFYSLDFAK